ncbi:AcrR family transcriptional regulator [Caulobacter ginsengisoli]|uniref:AcrR family transcriptional regulator n=1 Tax=Caulobacter ginsengisoli TaxID=400775 RepID=A0ABU0IUH2_9CAUL|nr:TetR/AcrR family transcriptional regulator [Caulobacter ginsengisoli]MDQ0465663.1 AcrR family transcriptional regulator [Caulobacter ginsengisoli]
MRAALLDAATQLIEAQTDDKVSLRACARLAGVSHAAPAHYFPTRAALISAVLAHAFDKLTEAMIAARDAAGDDPFDRLKGTGRAYVAFGLAHPALYTMMFRPTYLQVPDGEMAEAGGRCGAVLGEAVAATPRPGGLTVAAGMAMAWTTVHGFVGLVSNGLVLLDEDPMTTAERILEQQRTAFSG